MYTELNCETLLEEIKEDLNKWTELNIIFMDLLLLFSC